MRTRDRFYFACLRDTVGTNMTFHGKGGSGYPTDLDKAEILTKKEAQRFWEVGREFDLPVDADLVDANAVFHVDCQHIPHESTTVDGCTQYVAYIKRKWNGNDVYWLTETGGNSTDFLKAKVFAAPVVEEGVVCIPFFMADAKKRRTFDLGLLNKRTMVQGAGLVTPAHVKRELRRKSTSGKTRVNCPDCGKINWQHNYHEFESCAHCGAS